MVDMSNFIAPRSDQLNADDLLAGPLTITISKVRASEGTPEQPVEVHIEGSNKPYKPCKSMRRVMVSLWGADASQYVGRSMTLYRDPEVQFGGMKVGGIRIGEMSHIDKDAQLVLTASKTKRAPFVVKKMKAQVSREPVREEPAALTPKEAAEMIKQAGNVAELRAVFGEVYKHFPAYDDATRDALTDLKDAVKLDLTEAV
ncbi:MAG: hypothetical protein CFE27_14715 [Alphaproteobacteria bacterium PA1]|nr:MAG: hypothetical protein CFE27_14715 [Alphaproteobacteria bacterium PA1]